MVQPPVDPRQPGPKVGRKSDNRKVTDTITGPNLRVSDNLIQAVAIGAFLLLGVAGGAIYDSRQPATWIIGGLVGTVVGLIGSGAAIGIYRLFRH
jgi:hypothetical protein